MQKCYDLIDETEDFIVINKHCQISFEGSNGILSQLRLNFDHVYGIHRLDKATSGIMIFAKTKELQKLMSVKFSKREVSKKYIALSINRPKKKMGKIKGDLVKGRGGSYYLKNTMNNPAHTQFNSFYDEKRNLRVFELMPITGQTHQLRVHLKSIGSSILGDKRYSCDASDRMYLAATNLTFDLNDQRYSYKFAPNEGEHFVSNDFIRKIIES